MVRPRRRLHGRARARLPDGGAAHGGLFPRARAAGARGPHGRDARIGAAPRVRRVGHAAYRQALHGRRRRQGVARARAARRRLRRRGADDVGSGTRAHGRDARQAGGDPRLPHPPVPGRDQGAGHEAVLRHDRPDPGDRPGRRQALRPARCHWYGGGDSPHRRQHHVQEARGGAHGPRDRREAGRRRLPPCPQGRPGARAHDDRAGRGSRLPHGRAAHRDGSPARPGLRQLARDGRGDPRAARRGSGGSDGGDLRPGGRDAPRRRRREEHQTGAQEAPKRARLGSCRREVRADDRGAGRQPQGARGPVGAAAGPGSGDLRCPGDRGGNAGRAPHHRPGHCRHGRGAASGGRRHRPERRLRHHREAGGQGARRRAHRLRVRERRGGSEARI